MTSVKGGAAAPLLFASLAAASVASMYGAVAPAMATVALLLFAAVCGSGRAGAFTPLAAALLAYAGIVALHTVLISPAYSAAGLLHPFLLVAAFVAGRKLLLHSSREATSAFVLYCVALAAWGLLQVGPVGLARAQGPFETPATYGAAVNFALLGAAALALAGRRTGLLMAVAVLMVAALFAAGSRGAWIATAIGCAITVLLMHRIRQLEARRLALLAVVLASGWLLAFSMRAAPWPATFIVAEAGTAPTETARFDSTQSRLELFAASWNAWLERPATGTGYLTFRYVLEQNRAEVPSYGAASETWVVHNDYLQALQETGPVGALALVALVVLPLVLCYRKGPRLPEESSIAAIAVTAAVAAMAAHAMVDFPFHVPVTLVLFGLFLGTLDAILYPRSSVAAARVAKRTPWARAVRAAVVVLVAVGVLRPVAAEAAAEWGMRQFLHGDGRSAALWLGIARRIEPADWRYHWYAGQFWDAQAAIARKREPARLAAEAFAAGLRANPLEVRNLLGIISVSRRYRELLDPEPRAEDFLAWLKEAAMLAPLNPAVARERALVLDLLAHNDTGTGR